MDDPATPRKVVALCGGIGGAKLALGLYRTLAPHSLTVVVNTGDDFEHLGLTICPDMDTVAYTLAGLSDRDRGWGLAGESWSFMEALKRLGGEDWFLLGDHDLATHVQRTARLRGGHALSDVCREFAARLGIAARLLPATDDPLRTMVLTPEGRLAFQTYFVARRCVPEVIGIAFDGADRARLQPEVAAALASDDVEAIVICPSNPYLSVDPILAIPGFREALAAAPAPVVAVSPVVGGRAIKGPTAKIMRELGRPVTVAVIAAHYHGLLDGLVVDQADAAGLPSLDLPTIATQTVMSSMDDRDALARTVLAFAATLPRRQSPMIHA